MSGLEVLGAVAASVQLAGNCCTIGKRLLQQRSESLVAEEVHERCTTLLSEINEHMTKLSPTGRQAAQELAACLQRIKHKVHLHKQRNGWAKMFQVVTGKTFVYREQMMLALYRYQVSAVLDGNEMMGQLLAGQTSMSGKLNEMAMPLMEALAKLTSNIDSLRMMESTSRREEQTTIVDFQRNVLKTLTDTIREEVGALRKDLASRPLLAESSHMDRSELTADYGTMASYLKSIWGSGSFTTDQDIWECFYDVVNVYINDVLPVSFRVSDFPETGWEPETRTIHSRDETLAMEVSRQLPAGDRLMIQTPLKLKTTTRLNEGPDLLRLQFLLMFLGSSKDHNSKGVSLLGLNSTVITDFDNPNLAKVCYRVDDGGEFSALQRVNHLLVLSMDAQYYCWDDQVNKIVPFWKYLSLIPDPSCIWDTHQDVLREPEFSYGLNVIFRPQPNSLSAKNGLIPPEIVDRMACAQKEKSKECEFIDYITDDGEREQDDEEDKDRDDLFDNHGDPAYDESEVVDA